MCRTQLTEFKEIGAGSGGAVVYRAKWKNETVAVKVFRRDMFQSEQDLKQFEHELQLLATLRHSHVVTFYGISYNVCCLDSYDYTI